MLAPGFVGVAEANRNTFAKRRFSARDNGGAELSLLPQRLSQRRLLWPLGLRSQGHRRGSRGPRDYMRGYEIPLSVPCWMTGSPRAVCYIISRVLRKEKTWRRYGIESANLRIMAIVLDTRIGTIRRIAVASRQVIVRWPTLGR